LCVLHDAREPARSLSIAGGRLRRVAPASAADAEISGRPCAVDDDNNDHDD
jgi:hypothetical protein